MQKKQKQKQVEEDTALVNSSPEEKGWLFKLKLADVNAAGTAMGELMDEAAYKAKNEAE
jgi:glycine cleavage system H protein